MSYGNIIQSQIPQELGGFFLVNSRALQSHSARDKNVEAAKRNPSLYSRRERRHTKKRFGKRRRRHGTETATDLNYQAYIREAADLEKEYGNCIVAYHDGVRVAVGKDAKDLISKIPEEYKKRQLFIKHVPERKIHLRSPLRLVNG